MTQNPPRITIGVPVYNGAALLRDCLNCLAGQTSQEFTVIIMDNASTDATAEIAREFAARDSRFRVLRQPHTVDARQNFADVLAAADTEYFAWRAHDDLSDANWIEALTTVLDRNPWANLAVSRVVNIDLDGKLGNSGDPPSTTGRETIAELKRLIPSIQAPWFYGLYRREAVARAFARCCDLMPFVWSLDMLVMVSFVLNRALATTNATAFQCRITGNSQSYLQPNHYVDSWKLRRSLNQACKVILRESDLTFREKQALSFTVSRFSGSRSEKLRRILRGALGAWFLGRDGRVRRGALKRIAAS